MKGIKPISEQEKIVEKQDDDVKIFKIPAKMFEEFENIDDNNEEMFEYIAFNVVIEFLNTTCGLKEAESEAHVQEPPRFDIALEFPGNIASLGRSILHEVGNYFGLSHHSAGKKGGKRRFIMYPKTLFKEKQERELVRLEKEKAEIIEKYSNRNEFAGAPPKNPKTFREQVMLEIW